MRILVLGTGLEEAVSAAALCALIFGTAVAATIATPVPSRNSRRVLPIRPPTRAGAVKYRQPHACGRLFSDFIPRRGNVACGWWPGFCSGNTSGVVLTRLGNLE